MVKKLPDLVFEKKAWRRGFQVVIGVDEVGRGALAGPVVAGAVAFDRMNSIKKGVSFTGVSSIDDSKRLTSKRRQELDKIIRKNASWGIGEVGVASINKVGIVKATEKAMRQAVASLIKKQFQIQDARFKMQVRKGEAGNRNGEITNFLTPVSKPESCILNPESGRFFVLIDAFHVKYIPGVGLRNQQAVIKGDQKVLSIAAASIIAKVKRDKLMKKLGKKYRKYSWEKNKGYGTKDHQKAIRKYGVTKYHRREFVKNLI